MADHETVSGIARVATGMDIAYESFGPSGAGTVLLVEGLGTQMVWWHDEICRGLVDAGYRVIRFDNRDIGLSTHLDAAVPSIGRAVARWRLPYTIEDMAADTVGLADALDLERFHLVGSSMGGFISQAAAIAHPGRLHSLTLVMTSTGSRHVGLPKPAVLRRLAVIPSANSRDEAAELALASCRLTGSPGHLDEDFVREAAELSYDRADDVDGRLRQLAAIIGQRDRTHALRSLRVPTLVVHGFNDPLVSCSGGVALARTIPGATFVGHAGMGHDLPAFVRPTFLENVVAHMAAAQPAGQHGTSSPGSVPLPVDAVTREAVPQPS